MDSILKKGLFLVTLTGTIAAFPGEVHATDTKQINTMPSVGIEQVLNDCYSSEKEIEVEDYLVPTEKGEYLDMAFADVDTFLYIRSEPTKQSEWVGKLYPDYAAKITGPVGDWTPIESGSVSGYVCSDYIIIGNSAEQKAQEIITEAAAEIEAEAETEEEAEAEVEGETEAEGDADADTETAEIPEEVFAYAESREEEEERLAREAEEAAARAAEEARAAAGSGQAVVDYACQFIGNPYVWGGTSLTNGADCSGFVQSVFANFGVSLPRTSAAQRSAGVGISYSEARPGDLILYEGHVGIYMGNGQIVNAMNESDGIGICPATYTNIVAVRRVL